MTERKRVAFSSAGSHPVQLEGMLHLVESEELIPAAVVCHPHPLGGGSMHNKVVVAIARALADQGIMALRFNFRGVGASEGQHDHGQGELEDVAGALDWLLDQPGVDRRRVSLAGYSFGAWVGLMHAQADPRVAAAAMVGLPAEYCDAGAMRSFARPKLFVTGEYDQLAPPGALSDLVEQLPAPNTIRVVHGADHFWAGLEQKVGLLVADFVSARGQLYS
jgi:alpha/beta superfamily hydrolase